MRYNQARILLVGILAACVSQAFPQQQSPTGLSTATSEAAVVNQNQQAVLPDSPSATMLVYSPATSMKLEDRLRAYSDASSRPDAVLGVALSGLSQLETEPQQWKRGGAGYGYRMAAGISRQAVSESIRIGLAAFDGEDPRYHRSEDTSVLGRARHAIVGTFTSERADGSLMPAYSRFAGAYGAAFVSNTWYMDPRANAGWAMRRGSSAIVSNIGLHLLQEFAPRNKYFKLLGLSNEPR
jgi:hypothetical protein